MANDGKTENKEVTVSFKKLMSFLFKDPLRCNCLPSSKVFFVPRDHILVRYEIPVRRYVLRPKPGRTA